MTRTKVALIQLDNYGPWTVTPEPRREMNLQSLQSQLFGDIARFVGSRDGYVFPARFDNMVAVTNGIQRDSFATLQELIADRYPVTVSVGIGSDSSPGTALAQASTALQEFGSAQAPDRTEVLCGEPITDEQAPDDVQVAHFDVVDATGKYTDRMSAFDSYITVEKTYSALRDFLYEQYDALSFFVGGDNVIAVCPDLSESALEAAIDHVRSSLSVELRVGTGHGPTACDAGLLAKEALEQCRHRETAIERATTEETTVGSTTRQ